MAHDIWIENGSASMMYYGDPPWHGLGTELHEPATAREAIEAARLDYQVLKKPVFARDEGDVHTSPLQTKLFALVPSDRWGKNDCPVYGIVSDQYAPLQNGEAFEFFDPIVGAEAAIYHTAGALGKGERVWILAKLPSNIRVVGDDIVDKYLLLSNSHDGKNSVQVKFTPIRVVCQNTLTMALSEGPTIKVAHTRDLHQRLDQARQMLGLVNTRYGEIEAAFRQMVRVQMNGDRLDDYLRFVFPDPADPLNERAAERVQNNRQWSEYLFDQGKGNAAPGVKGTLWAAYNGVTEYIDYGPTYGGHTRRLGSCWFGNGYLTKARAFRVAEAKLDTWSRN
ncbi:MAG: DUF932 domain-containing protein [Armatimonadetes bacterium]|nr:DUF932 domain-containing protein [Armatimonadota bacterium]